VTERARGRPRETLRRLLLRRADAVLVNGASGARYCEGLGVGAERIFRAPQTSDIAPLLRLPVARPPEAMRRLLYVGRLLPLKGLTGFCDSLARHAEAHRDERLELWLVGDGPLGPQLRARAFPANVRVRCLGERPFAELPELYRQAGLLVFPSLADEWGLVVNEAMAAGLPVLGSVYSQAVDELVQPGVQGWRFRPDSPAETDAALAAALATPDGTLDRMRRAARETAAALAPERIADIFVDALRFALDRRGSP
jgi:glycosyltransferase involved in cell wall biosynthesis